MRKWFTIIWVLAVGVGLCFLMNDESREEEVAYLEESCLEKLVLPVMEFSHGDTVRDVVTLLSEKTGGDGRLKKLVSSFPDEVLEMEVGVLSMGKISVADVLDLVLFRCGLRWHLDNGELILDEVEWGDEPMARLLALFPIHHIELTEDTFVLPVINFLRLRTREVEWDHHYYRGRIFNYNAETETKSEGDLDWLNRKVGQLMLKDVRMGEVLVVVCRRAGLKIELDEEKGEVVFSVK